MTSTAHLIIGGFVALATITLDQLIKIWVMLELPFQQHVDILPIFSLYFTYNTGVAFSFMNNLSPLALLALASVITVIMLALWWTGRRDGLYHSLGFGLIVGGAIGNMIDRGFYGKVVDYVSLHYGDFYFAVFNLADAALTIGVVVLLINSFWTEKKKKTQPAA